MQAKYFLGFIICFVVGVAVEEIFDLGISFAVFCLLLAVVLFLVRDVRMNTRAGYLVSLLFIGYALGVIRMDVSQMWSSDRALDSYQNMTVQLAGIIADEPDVREKYTNIVLEVNRVLYRGTEYVLDDDERVLVRVGEYPPYAYGDEVLMRGELVVPKNFINEDGERSFDYRAYLAKDDIFHQMYYPEVFVIAHEKGNVVQQKLFTLKHYFLGNIAENIAEPEASLAGGITLGAKQSLGDDLLAKFRETGVAHIVVLSGYNIAVVAGIISRLIMFTPFSVRLIMSALGITLFAVMVGGGATVVRATVMALVIILARMLGRESDALRVLVLAGGLMVFANPMILLHDVSFQLSFVATLAIVVFAPIVERYFLFVSSRVFREIIVATIATQIFVLPLILYHMGTASLIGFISNIFILPVVPIAMIAVALVALFGGVYVVGAVIAFLAYALLSYMVTLVELFARVPFASLHDIPFPFSALILAYALIGFFVVKNFSRGAKREKSEYRF